jgi:hypothetical protein
MLLQYQELLLLPALARQLSPLRLLLVPLTS